MQSTLRRTFRVPLTVERSAAGAAPCPTAFPVDLIALLQGAGCGGVPDPQSLRLVAADAPHPAPAALPVQFTPDLVPRLPLDAPGDPPPSWICRFPAGPGDPVRPGVALRGGAAIVWTASFPRNPALEFDVYEAGQVVQLPYPPNTFRILLPDGLATPPAFIPPVVVHSVDDGTLELQQEAAPILGYRYRSEVRKPYFYPVISPGGQRLTRLGHPHDPGGTHQHHRSLWIAHGDVGGVDFWHDWRQTSGAIVHRGFTNIEQGPVCVRLEEDLDWVGPGEGRVHLRERRCLTVWTPASGVRLFDLELTLTPPEDIVLGRSLFGFAAFRSAETMTPYDGGGLIRNAEGLCNDRLCLRPSRWADFTGPVAPGRQAGIAILDHAENPRHPTAFYCRNDGWLGTAHSGLGPVDLASGQPLRLRYRLVLHDDEVETDVLDAAWQAFVRPVRVAPRGPAVETGRSA